MIFREVIRKKSLLVMYRFWKLNPDAYNFTQCFHEALFDTDPAVMQSSLIAYYDLIQASVHIRTLKGVENSFEFGLTNI